MHLINVDHPRFSVPLKNTRFLAVPKLCKQETMSNSRWLFSPCRLLMAALFAYSASVQLNDHDWYFWFPLYACASVVNLINWAMTSKAMVRLIITLLLGIFLFLKVAIEDFVTGKAGLLSLDLSERVVREKTGSGLVMVSMILHLEASSEPLHHPSPRKKKEIPRWVEYGMTALVCFSFGLPFVLFVIRKGEMRFDYIEE